MDGLLPRRFFAWMIALGVAAFVCDATRAADNLLAHSMIEDAELHDVTFADDQHGWAVGDRGIIWRTENAGQSWEPIPTGIPCTLRSVHFNNAESGWAAGGQQRPYLDANKGVLLHTVDGGRTWEADKGTLLATFRVVKFFGPQGWALAEPSALFPSSVFYTDNEGRSWTPLADREPGEWTVADFANPQVAAIAGARGARAAISQRRLDPWQQSEYGLREPRAVRLANAQDGWLAGDGGLLLTTHDGGRSWQPAPQEPLAGDQFDFRTVEIVESHLWVAGSPGARIMHSPDGGKTWESQPTGQSLPINKLKFVDAEHGWAVGALGTILVTIDGGRTWQKQHGARERVALFGVYSDAERVPLEAVARLAANEGYITAIELVARRDAEPDTTAAVRQTERERAALLAIGCSSAERTWGFPLRQSGLQSDVEHIVDGWNRMYAGQGVERLEEHLVRQLRTWRPEIVFTSAASPSGDDPLGHLVNQVVLRAVADAGSSEKFPEQLADVGLSPWTVKKVAGSLPAGKLGTINVNTSQLAPRLARSLADYASNARGLLGNHYAAPPNAWGFRLYVDGVGQGMGQQDFFSGLSLAPASDTRRELPTAGRAGMDAMRQIAEKHRNLQAILAHTERSDRGPAVLLGQIGDLTRGLDPETAGQTLFELGHTYRADGHWEFAASTFQLLAEKYPSHALAAPSLAWLVQYWSSSEALTRSQPAPEPRSRSAARNTAGLIPAAMPPPATLPLPSVVQTASRGEAQPPLTGAAARYAKAVEAARSLERIDAQAWSDMHVQFPLAIARTRTATAGPQVDRFFATVSNTRPRDAWWACARGEQWLLEGTGAAPPKAAATARRAAEKPLLDGDLADDVWQQAARLELSSSLSDDAEWPGTVMLAYDDEFLYVAIDCRRAPQGNYPAENRTRERDADLSAHDRIELRLDVDRDWTTFYNLSVDHRGWTADDCWGDASWNPRWFVAAARGEENWTVEAAIPLNQLSSEPVGPKTVWALGLQRIVPGVGFQSWTRPATVAGTPEGCGYFIFE